MASIVYVSSSTTDVITEIASTSEVIISNLQGPQGATGPQGPQGTPGGIASVVAPITNAGTETAAIIGINSSSANTANYVVQRDANKEFVAGAVTIDTTLTPTSAPGKLYWDGGGTVNLGLAGGNVSVALGENLVSYVTNAEATTLAVGEVVYVFGASGDRPSVKRASNASEVTSSKTLGIVAESIAAGAIGFVVTRGIIGKLTLGSYTEGAPVYLGATAGTFTSTKPVAPANLVALGWVIRANNGNGQIYLNVQNGFELEELHNVSITSAANGNFLVYDSATELWKNQAISATAPVTYNAGTRTIAANSASTSASGVVQLSDSTSTTSSTLAATPTAVKAAYDLATTANATANAAIPLAQKAAANGVATLDASGLVPTNQLPALAITNTFVVNSQAAMLALTAQPGDVAIRTDLSESYILTADPASTLANWQELLSPPDAVTSVDGRVGAVTLTDKYAQLATANTFTTSPQQINGAASSIGLIVKANATTPGDLTQWQSSSGTVLANITSAGSLNFTQSGTAITTPASGRLNIGGAVYGTGFFGTISITGDNGGYALDARGNATSGSVGIRIRPGNAANVGLVIQGETSQSGDLQQWNSTSAVLANITSAGGIETISGMRFYTSSARSAWSTLTNTSGNLSFNYQFALTDRLTVTAGAAATVPVTVKGAASQTGELQVWQNNSGTVLARVNASGIISSTEGIQSGSASFAGIAYNGISNPTGQTGLPSLIVKGITSQTASLQEWHSSAGLVSSVDTSGQLRTPTVLNRNSFNNSRIQIRDNGTLIDTGIATNIALTVQTTNASPTADYFQIQNSGGTPVFRFASSNSLVVQYGSIATGTATALGQLTAVAANATTVGEVVRGAASATANLTEWQNSAGTVLANMSSGGRISVTNIWTPTVQATGGGSGAYFSLTANATTIATTLTASVVPLTIRGAASQSADLLQIQDSSANVLNGFDANGNLKQAPAELVQYGAEGSVLQNIPTRVHPAETLLKQAVWWIDSAHSGSSGQAIKNLGWGGAALDATAGSTTSADSNDPLYLPWSGVNYVYIPSGVDQRLSVPSAASLDITGDIDLRVQIAMDDWTLGAANARLIGNLQSGGTTGYGLDILATGVLSLSWGNGTTSLFKDSTVAPTVIDGNPLWVRATLDVDNGASGYDVKFFTSNDGLTWTQLGTTVTTAGTTSIAASTNPMWIGRRVVSNDRPAEGKYYRAQILNGIDGVPVLDVDTSVIATGAATSFTALTGQTVTINRSTSGRKTTVVTHPVWLFGTDDYMEVNNRWLERTTANYLYLPGVAGNYASAPDSAALDITGDIDLRVKVALDDWTPAAANTLLSKATSATPTEFSYQFNLTSTGALSANFSLTGSLILSATSSAVNTFVDGSTNWVRVTRASATGDVIFYTSPDGTTWTQLGTTQTTTSGSLYAGTAILEIGSRYVGTTTNARGKFFRAQVLNGIGGTVAFDANFETGITTNLPTTFTESSANAATVTINYSGTGYRSAGVIASTYVFPGNPNTFKLSAYPLLGYSATEDFSWFFVFRSFATPANFGVFMDARGINDNQAVSLLSSGTSSSMLANLKTPSSEVTAPANAWSSTTINTTGLITNRTTQTLAGFMNGTIGSTISISAVTALNAGDRIQRIGVKSTGANNQDFEFVSAAIFRRALTAAEIATLNSYFQGRVA